MRFPNAAAGVKKIFSSQVLALIAAIASVIAIALAIIGIASGSVASADPNAPGSAGLAAGAVGAGIGTALLLVVAGVLGIIAFIMQIVGIGQASKDETSFKTAMICLIIGIVGAVVASIFSSNSVVYGIGSMVSQLMSLFVTIFVISGIIKLADQLNDGAVSAKGSTLLKMITVVYALALIASLIVLILGGYAASVVAGIIALVSYVLNIIAYFMYLSLLSKAKNMLAAN